ncbi:protein of unknown function DUF222 [Frankia torreyi]|uniref:DUF222 domain-containing protein n=1 Tax=Frankia torreyi TaxID=1856 RepID=A0A0D8BI29_9ACTN|nr:MULTISPECIES: DUF222 domain-containing protein [Frankia]KJE23908.1 protein of unknown function DUF222 [Frankia torreyi]
MTSITDSFVSPLGFVAGMAAVHTSVDGVLDAPLWPLSDTELALAVDESAAALSRLAAVRLQLVREVQGRGLALRVGAESTQEWLRERLRVRPVDARHLLDLAAALDGPLTATGSALAEGRITVEQALVIFRVMRSVPALTTPDVVADAEACLIEQAAIFDPTELTRIGQRIHQRVSQPAAGSKDADPPEADPPEADPPEADPPEAGPPEAGPPTCTTGGSDGAAPGDSAPAPGAGSRDDADDADGCADGDAVSDDAVNEDVTTGPAHKSAADGAPDGGVPPIQGSDHGRPAAGTTTTAPPEHTRARRGLWLTDLPEGMTRLDGELDAQSAATLRSALEQLTGADAATDDHAAAPRRVDALLEIVRRAQMAAMLTVTGGSTADLADAVSWAVLRASGNPPPDSGTAGHSIPVMPPKLAMMFRSGQVGSQLTAVHADVEKWRRSARQQLRQAAGAGDRLCVAPGCDRSARWCDGHLLRA